MSNKTESIIEAMRTAFEFGYRSCEKGLNLQAAMAKFERTMHPRPILPTALDKVCPHCERINEQVRKTCISCNKPI